MDEKFELSYGKKEINTVRILFYLACILEIVLFAVTLYLTATYVDKETSGDSYIILGMIFIVILPFWIMLGAYYKGLKRWSFNFDGTYFAYCPKHKSLREFSINDIKEVELRKYYRLIIRNQYGEVIVKERINKMPGAYQVLQVLQAHQIPFEYGPGTQEIKYLIQQLLNADSIQDKYVEEPVNEKRNQNDKKLAKYNKLINIIYILSIFAWYALVLILGNEYFILLFGMVLFVDSCIYVIQHVIGIKQEELIRRDGQEVTGTVKEFIHDIFSKNNRNCLYPNFEFQLDDGYHLCTGIRPNKLVNSKNSEHFLNEEYQIYYAPSISTNVSYDNNDEFRKYKRNTRIVMGVFMGIAIATLSVGGISVYQQHVNNSLYQDAGSSAKITYNKKYEPSNFTQDDIDGNTVKWIAATCATYNYVNDLDSTKIGGAEPGSSDAEGLKKMLVDGWGIKDRKTAIDALNTMLDRGQRKGYHKIITQLQKEGVIQMDEGDAYKNIDNRNWSDEKKQRYHACIRAYTVFGDRGLDAWDYCREIQILGDCYLSGYISLEECLDQALPVAQILQDEFNSWDEMNQSYLYGYWYYTKTNPEEKCSDSYYRFNDYYALTFSKDNPYKTLKYNMKLKDTWSRLAE